MRQLKSSLQRTFHQTVFDFERASDQPPSHPFIICNEEQREEANLAAFAKLSPLGLAPGYGKDGKLIALAISDGKNGRLIEFKPERISTETRTDLQDLLSSNPSGVYAFDCGTLAMSLYMDLGVRLKDGVDIQSAFPQSTFRKPQHVIKEAFGKGDSVKLLADNLSHIYLNTTYDIEDPQRHLHWYQQAWLAQFIVNFSNNRDAFSKVPKINTADLNFNVRDSSNLIIFEATAHVRQYLQYLEMLAKISTDGKRLDYLKPAEKEYSFTRKQSGGNPNEIVVASNTFNNRIRNDTNVQMTISGRFNNYVVSGTANAFVGPSGAINSIDEIADDEVVSLRSVGRDDPTSAELNRDITVLKMLSDPSTFENAWIRNVWYTHQKISWKKWRPPIARRDQPHDPDADLLSLLGRLNASQTAAVDAMLDPKPKQSLVVIQGPPGTGKTSVISAFVSFAVNSFEQSGIWLVAQSNVAVKNIAEKLVAIGFRNWKLLVSKDFHLGWHEHLYGKVESYVIRSEEFNTAPTRKKMQNVKVILCTLSMLSNKRIKNFTKYIPIETLVIDEASQIEIGSYLSVFLSFQSSLRKVIFIGDDKQLPPYGQEDLKDLQSIFEIPHLQENVYFLDTQYRMPPQIGGLISTSIYDGKLKSNPKHPAANNRFTCFFIDIEGDEERAKDSFKVFIFQINIF
ncbi:hypothetical protein CVT24_000386 [Panaeolus cyanescens]|uniref:DNA2/NAM7 helicase-like C-terminal domain-containing protein n=1 Tax=Panaeolus cyanescens TaxID=181874 RepID=A0A409YD26_9AGAR|nr:hypothetical protein CVT24_000386 [Panaeolus cyanescens]